MLIPSSNFNTVILLMEVDLNCEIIARSTEKLRIAAMHRINLSQGIDDAGKATKIDIITDCFACLTAAAAVSRLLCLGDRKGKRADRIKQRCDLLMNEL
jgi:hypothetical protein